MHLPRLLVTAAASLALACGSLTVSSLGVASATTSRGVEIPKFYDPPARVSGQPGSVLRAKPLPLSPELPGLFPGKAQRMMYVSRDSSGDKTAVTGAFIRSTATWSGPGRRPLVAFAVGTMGQGDQCAPSYGLEHPLVVGIAEGQSTTSLNYEMLAMSQLLSQGYNIALTDYIGLGTTDRVHTYVNRVDEGRAMLDAARAARHFGIPAKAPVGLWGYSQGGGAAASAAELQPSYAPDVNVRGAFAGAPPANLVDVLEGIDGNIISGVVGFALNGFMASYPKLRPIVEENVNEEGAAKLGSLSTACIGDAIAEAGFAQTSSWTKSGESLAAVIARHPAAQRVVDRQRIGNREPGAPVLVTSDRGDNTVPYAQVEQLARDWCDMGATVDFRPVGAPGAGDKASLHHIAGMVESLPGAMAWMADRFAEKPAVSTCDALEQSS